MSNFDIANLALQMCCPGNELIYDDKNMPSAMVKIPKCTWAQLGVGDSTEVFPAFKVNGKEIDAIYISKFQNIVQNNRAYSLPGQDPATSITFDTSASRCTAKGEGFHVMTRLEWMAVALWCLKNGHLPKGNNNDGKDHSETVYKAIPTYMDGANRGRVATGTGPLTWSHDNSPSGIWDLNGNVWEWNGGMRLVYGELQIISHDGVTFGNDAADPDNSQGASSSLWYAINGKTGALIKPDGSGTTANSLKLDWVSGAWKWITGALTSKSTDAHNCALASVTLEDGINDASKHILQALGLYKPDEGELEGDNLWTRNGEAERLFLAGGSWYNGASAGVFAVRGNESRAYSTGDVGFRAAYVKLPTA